MTSGTLELWEFLCAAVKRELPYAALTGIRITRYRLLGQSISLQLQTTNSDSLMIFPVVSDGIKTD